MINFRRVVISLAIASGFACMTAPAEADTINITGIGSDGFSSATVVVEFNSQTNTLTFTTTNTSNLTQAGSTSTIVSIGFDLPPEGNASSTGLNGFTGMQAPNLVSDFTFSDADLGSVPGLSSVVLDFGFLTGVGGTFASGDVGSGLLPAESATFTVTGAAFAGFTEAQIANSIYVMFRNVPTAAGTGGLDVGTSAPSVSAVPGPTTMMLVGTGVIALGRRRKAAKAATR